MTTWADIPGWTCPRLLELYDEVALAYPGGSFVEVGCAYGRSLAYLLRRVTIDSHVMGVDAWEEHMGGDNLPAPVFDTMKSWGSPKLACAHSLDQCGLLERVDLTEGRSVDVAHELLAQGRSFDFVFIDADHSYEAVKADIAAWLPLVRPGGTLAGHDYNSHYDGVRRAVAELLPGHQAKTNTDDWGGVWVHSVPA